MFEPSGNELRLPHITALYDPDPFCPLLVYCLTFQLLAVWVRRSCWRDGEHREKRFRLHNTTVCLVHSLISGIGVLLFAVTHSRLMLDDYAVLHWYEEWSRHLLLFSIGYFVYDTIDLLRNELSRWTLEYVLHHLACIFALLCALLSRKFVLYAYWALLMEVSSIFLHLRTICQLSWLSVHHPLLYRGVCYANATAFAVFRFLVQAWQLQWIWRQRPHIHSFYYGVGVYGGAFFFLINGCLFMQLLATDFPRLLLGRKRRRLAKWGSNGICVPSARVAKNGQMVTNGTANGVHKGR